MNDWLSEIEIDFEDENYPTRGDGQRMARVLRELAKHIARLEKRQPTISAILGKKYLSKDAKALCVAARE